MSSQPRLEHQHSAAPRNVSFAGCGFMGIYHIGVASCLRQHAPELLRHRLAGASAGALVACMLVCDCCLGQCTSYTLKLAAKARRRSLGPLHPEFDVMKHLRIALRDILPADAHIRCSGKLFISVTRVSDWKNVIISEYPTRQHLIDALLCTTFIPFYSGLRPPEFDGIAYVDGALSNNIPTFDETMERTITVSPFAGETDISPRPVSTGDSVTVEVASTPLQLTDCNLYRLSRVLFPPHPNELADICQLGFKDALRFLHVHQRVPTTVTLESCLVKLDVDLPRHSRLPRAVNKELSNAAQSTGLLYPLYQSYVYRVVSLAALPLYLPAEIVYRQVIKLLPALPLVSYLRSTATRLVSPWYSAARHVHASFVIGDERPGQSFVAVETPLSVPDDAMFSAFKARGVVSERSAADAANVLLAESGKLLGEEDYDHYVKQVLDQEAALCYYYSGEDGLKIWALANAVTTDREYSEDPVDNITADVSCKPEQPLLPAPLPTGSKLQRRPSSVWGRGVLSFS